MRSQSEGTGVALPHLRAWRDYFLLTQQELADQSDVSRATIIAAERGERISKANVKKLAGALGIDQVKLVHHAPASAPQETQQEGEGALVHAG